MATAARVRGSVAAEGIALHPGEERKYGERTPRSRELVSGTEANLLAMRLARAYTGRIRIAKTEGSYHGHADHTVVGSSTVGIQPKKVPAGVAPGVADELVEIPFNDPDGAAAILEREA